MAKTTKKDPTFSWSLWVDVMELFRGPGQLHHYLNQADWGEALRPFLSKHNQTNIHHSKRPFSFLLPPLFLNLFFSLSFLLPMTHTGDVLMTHLHVMPGKHLTQRWVRCSPPAATAAAEAAAFLCFWPTDSRDDSPLLLCSRMMSH